MAVANRLLKRTIDTIDYEEYEFGAFLGLNEVECMKRMCHVQIERITYGQYVPLRVQRYMVLKVKREIPEVIRLIIISMLTDLYRTTIPPMERVPRVILSSIREHFKFACFKWTQLHISENSVYAPLCRGYCLNCGNPQGIKRMFTFKGLRMALNTYTLTLMVLCYKCMADGFTINQYNMDYKTVEVPQKLERVKIIF